MISSYRGNGVIKARNQVVGGSHHQINWQDSVSLDMAVNLEVDKAIQDLISRAQEEAAAILEEAQANAAVIEAEAEQRARSEGYEAGWKEGLSKVQATWIQWQEPLGAVSELYDQLGRIAEGLHDDKTWAQAGSLAQHFVEEWAPEHAHAIAPTFAQLAQRVDSHEILLYLDARWRDRVVEVSESLSRQTQTIRTLIDETLDSGHLRIEGEAGGVLASVTLNLKTLIAHLRGEMAHD